MGRAAALAAAAGLAAGAAGATDATLGRIQFALSCAQCHGVEGRGDGPLAEFLTTPPPDLTGLQRANGGVFPFAHVYATIETGGGIGAHGASEMPAWRERLVLEAWLRDGIAVPPEAQEGFARARILALVDHIARLQEP